MTKGYIIGFYLCDSQIVLFGAVLVIIGTISVLNIDYFYLSWLLIYILSVVCIIIGVTAILFAVCLAYCMSEKHPILAALFSCLLIGITITAIICATILLRARSKLEETTLDKTEAIFNDYSISNGTSESNTLVSNIQQLYRCCGVQTAMYWQNRTSDRTSAPDSCCQVMTNGCGKGTLITQKGIYLDGCATSLLKYLQTLCTLLIVTNFVVAVFACLTSVIALYLRRFIRIGYNSL